MKKFYLIVLLLFAFQLSSFAGVKTLTRSTSNIMDVTAWSGGQLPQPGDTVIIPASRILTLSSTFSFPFSTHLRVYGEIRLTGSPINISLDAASTIIIYGGGRLSGTVAAQRIYLNGLQIYNGIQTINGAMWATQATNGFVPYGVTSTLPVKFIGFTATRKNNDVLVQWSTSEEVNASIFEVERSINGAEWSTIAYVAAIGNSSSVNNYSFTDKSVFAKLVCYRIKEIDADGKTTITPVQTVKMDGHTASGIKIASVQKKVLLQFPSPVKSNVIIRFVSMNGQVIDQQTINNPVGQVVLESKLTGNYIISLSNGHEINTAKQVIL